MSYTALNQPIISLQNVGSIYAVDQVWLLLVFPWSKLDTVVKAGEGQPTGPQRKISSRVFAKFEAIHTGGPTGSDQNL